MHGHWDEDPYFHRRNLPHFAPDDAPYFITFRLAGSLPLSIVKQLKTERQRILELAKHPNADREAIRLAESRLFSMYDCSLDRAQAGPTWLRIPEIAAAVKTKILSLEEEGLIKVHCFSIMSNHVHILMSLASAEAMLKSVMQRVKGGSALECNRLLGRQGKFWQPESYDHVVRERGFDRIVRYILMNAVKAGLCKEWREYPHVYLSPNIYGY